MLKIELEGKIQWIQSIELENYHLCCHFGRILIQLQVAKNIFQELNFFLKLGTLGLRKTKCPFSIMTPLSAHNDSLSNNYNF